MPSENSNEHGTKTAPNAYTMLSNSSTVSPSNHGTVYGYDDLGALACTKDATGDITTEYSTDPEGRPLYVADSRGNQADFAYDSSGEWMRMDVKPSFLPAAIRFRHDKRSSERRLLSTCDGKWYETKLDYDGRVTEHSVGDNNTVSSRYQQSLAYAAAPYGPSSRVSALQFRKVSPNEESVFFALPVSLEYTYDDNGRIQTVTEKQGSVLQPTTTDRAEYTYGVQGQLIRENQWDRNKTVTYSYDLNGNLTEQKRFGYTTGTVIIMPFRKTETYPYDGTWKDLLTGYNGTNNIRYDAIGNPTDYLGKTLVWTQGRRRKSVNGTVRYRYNESGLRISKTENGITTQSFWLGSQLMSPSNTSGPAQEFVYWYDQSGNLVGFRYNGTHYYYVKNLQGDVIGILDSSHNVVARYTYDTWGKLLKITDGSGNDVTGSTTHIGYLNPVRYYYDNETGWYYLQSRYYNPETGHFISPDTMDNTALQMIDSLVGGNMYAYCLNNPVMYL